MTPLFYALGSNICFAIASLYFTEFSKKTSAEWMNFAKAFVASVAFLITVSLLQLWHWPHLTSLVLLMVSGFLGLLVGDIFLLKAFTHLGPGRVLMIFGFQPLFLGVASWSLFQQDFPLIKGVAVVLLLLCLLCFSLESFKTKGHWDLVGLGLALAGVLLDATGLLMTRRAFDLSPELHPLMGNFIRAATAAVGFILYSQLKPSFKLLQPFWGLVPMDRLKIVLAGLGGTYLSLGFYLMAVQSGHLASISAIAGTSPLFATLIETLLGKKRLNRYLVAGLIFFILGFLILITNGET